MSYDVIFHNMFQVINGVSYPTRMGVGPDGTLWLDPDDLGIPPEDVEKLARHPGPGPMALLDSVQRRLFVNAQALAEIQTDPAIQEAMVRTIKMLLWKLRPSPPNHESLRKN